MNEITTQIKGNNIKSEIVASITQIILAGLHRQEFADWYADGERFDAYLGTADELKKEFDTENYRVAQSLIIQDIQRIFQLDEAVRISL